MTQYAAWIDVCHVTICLFCIYAIAVDATAHLFDHPQMSLLLSTFKVVYCECNVAIFHYRYILRVVALHGEVSNCDCSPEGKPCL